MSVGPEGIKQALAALQNAWGQSGLTYRVSRADTWHPFTGFLLPGAPQLIGYDENRAAIMMPTTARLKIPTDGVHLTPGSQGAPGAEVQEASGVVWAVVGSDHGTGQSIYILQRAPMLAQGPARGGVP